MIRSESDCVVGSNAMSSEAVNETERCVDEKPAVAGAWFK